MDVDVSVYKIHVIYMVCINVTKSLTRGICVYMDDQIEVSLLFQYEFLLDLCFSCGISGH